MTSEFLNSISLINPKFCIFCHSMNWLNSVNRIFIYRIDSVSSSESIKVTEIEYPFLIEISSLVSNIFNFLIIKCVNPALKWIWIVRIIRLTLFWWIDYKIRWLEMARRKWRDRLEMQLKRLLMNSFWVCQFAESNVSMNRLISVIRLFSVNQRLDKRFLHCYMFLSLYSLILFCGLISPLSYNIICSSILLNSICPYW